jgi:hypothetical protein
MGFCHESHGPNRISVEARSESFYIHPGYGYFDGNDPDDRVVLGGERVARASFARHWREEAHPELLLEDVPYLILALADLETCPPIVKASIALHFDAPGMLAEQITPEEAENLFRAFTGGEVDAALFDSVTPKLEALAGKELVA